MVYQFKIKLRGITKPPVWRRVVVPEQFTFNDFHNVIQAAFGWFNDHLYEFGAKPYDHDLYIAIPSKDDWEAPTHDSRKTQLNKIFVGARKKMVYVYDFGDDWIHEIELEKTIDEHRIYAECIAGKGACPEEDCGGIYGYEDMKYSNEVEDADAFSLDEANAQVRAVKSGESFDPFDLMDDEDDEDLSDEEDYENEEDEEEKAIKTRKSHKRMKITNQEWLAYMPYDKFSDIDKYYVDIVKRVYDVLASDENFEEEFYLDDARIQNIAMNLTLWFMDVISEGNMWHAFTTECKQRYGKYLPFFDIDESDYYPDEVNLEDVHFLLWHYIQCTQNGDGKHTFHPKYDILESMAWKLYHIFEDEFENAPINDDWHDALQPQALDEPLSINFTRYVMMLANRCDYLGYGCREAMLHIVNEIITSKDEISKDDFAMKYGDGQMDILFCGTDLDLLGLTVAEWAVRIIALGNKQLAKRIGKLEVRDKSAYTVLPEDDKYLKLKEIRHKGEGKEFDVVKDGIIDSESEGWQQKDIVLFSRLLKCGGEWTNCGLPSSLSRKEFDEDPSSKFLYADYDELHNQLIAKVHNMFFGSFEKKYFKNTEEIKALFSKFGNINDDADAIIRKFDAPCLILKLKNGDYQPVVEGLECIKDKDNPFYNKKKAQQDAIEFLTDDVNVTYEMACELLKRGMLDDAMIYPEGGKEERTFVKRNAQFLLDYFYNKHVIPE